MADTPKSVIAARKPKGDQTGWATRDEVAAHWRIAPRTVRERNALPQSDPRHLPSTKRLGGVRIAWAVVHQYEARPLVPSKPRPQRKRTANGRFVK